MKVRLTKDARITVKAGETVEVSPAMAELLMRAYAAEPVPEKKPAAKKKTTE